MSGPAYPDQPGPDDKYPGQQYPGYNQYPPQQPPVSPKNGMGIAALILGILSILAFWSFGFGILLGIVAVILGVIGRGRAKRREATNGGIATAGIVTGVLGILAGAAFLALSIWVFNEVGFADIASCISDANGDQQKIEQCQQDFSSNLENRFSVTVNPQSTP